MTWPETREKLLKSQNNLKQVNKSAEKHVKNRDKQQNYFRE